MIRFLPYGKHRVSISNTSQPLILQIKRVCAYTHVTNIACRVRQTDSESEFCVSFYFNKSKGKFLFQF
jgi:hypothetical protein